MKKRFRYRVISHTGHTPAVSKVYVTESKAEIVACLRPEHFGSRKSNDVAVKRGRFADVGRDVVHLNAKLRRRFLALRWILCQFAHTR